MVRQMLKRLVQWLKNLFQSLFGRKPTPKKADVNVQTESAPPLSDTDLEFLFTELLEGVHQARGQAWAIKWLHKVEHRVSSERWIEWLRRFGDRLLAAPTPNNELAARLVQLGDLGVGEVGDEAYEIGMQLLTRNSGEPIWEYEGPDAFSANSHPPESYAIQEEAEIADNSNPEGDYQTVTLEQLFAMMQEDHDLRQQLAQQLAIESDDPEVIIQELVNQYYTPSNSTSDEAQV
ncbi:hypothetical protein IQ259_22375 [Fortiea sp. LEGE XX443]|uniref:hypothetical protein n=1 Tax=Fortiea sp. LEGE XX443 TaxID=1828611 RepID=UPI00187EC11A|nr:hypothetical protein [Fortiea sp. LEGE XX443]MBE9007731.1 hypothetical protein [Fortiea sp. LEGE XX443]